MLALLFSAREERVGDIVAGLLDIVEACCVTRQ